MPPLDKTTVGFLGAGKMAAALARGWIGAGLVAPEQILASDPLPQARTDFTTQTGAAASADNREIVRRADLLILAVKPQTMAALLAEVRPLLAPRHLVLSIAAGISLRQLTDGLGTECRVMRIMPNTPALVGTSATGFAAGGAATPEDMHLVQHLFNSVGRCFPLPEKLLDAVTGLSGSGPAYVFVAIEALADGGVRMGLPRDVALQLAAQTFLGAAKMQLETGLHPAALKDMVASPGGTTIAGLHALEHAGFRAALMDAVQAATQRSAELGK